jgi:hypothetical protein
MVTRMRLNITSYVHCLSLSIKYHLRMEYTKYTVNEYNFFLYLKLCTLNEINLNMTLINTFLGKIHISSFKKKSCFGMVST